jgi:hypothetical protein
MIAARIETTVGVKNTVRIERTARIKHLLGPAARVLPICAAVALLAGCASLGTEPWERNVLARDDMQIVSDPIEASVDQHIYFSKEASSGGQGFGGGGCGCN